MNNHLKIGRNDVCLCGSGKKYKSCCLLKAEPKILDFDWRKIRQTEGVLVDKYLLPYAFGLLPKPVLETSFIALCTDVDLPEEMRKRLYEELWTQWLLFDWIPDMELSEVSDLEQKPIALQFLEKEGRKLTDYQKRFIETICQTHFSFYVVLEVVPEKSVKLRDIFLQTEHDVKEKTASRHLKRGDITFTRILTLDGQSICVGSGGYTVPSYMHTQLLDFRQDLESKKGSPLTQDDLGNIHEWELRAFFVDSIWNQYKSPMPALYNTDDEPVQFCKVYCTLNLSPEQALERLLPLTLSRDPKAFLAKAKRGQAGEVVSVAFPWLREENTIHKDWSNTAMGHIAIDGPKLTVEVNSEARAKTIVSLLQTHLKEDVLYQKTRIESPEQKLKSDINKPAKKAAEVDINELPEVKAFLAQFAKKHWETWLDTSIPALNGLTPRTSAKTKEGRERLEALFLDFERKNESGIRNAAAPDVDYLRKQLGMNN